MIESTPDPSGLHLTIYLDSPTQRCGRVRAAGELDAGSAHALVDAVGVDIDEVAGPHIERLELDLRLISFCDAAGARAVVAAAARAEGAGLEVRMLTSPCIRRIWAIGSTDP